MSMYLTLTTIYDTNKWIIYQKEFKKVVCVKYASSFKHKMTVLNFIIVYSIK